MEFSHLYDKEGEKLYDRKGKVWFRALYVIICTML